MTRPRFAWLTPPGTSALSVLLLKDCDWAACDHPRLYWLRDEAGNAIDQTMIAPEAGCTLMTCHGGTGVRAGVEAELTRRGVQRVSPTELPLFGSRNRFERRKLHLLTLVRGSGGLEMLLRMNSDALGAALDYPENLPNLLTQSSGADFLFEPPRVQLWGPVNAGKSSLFNALCERPLAAVGDEPGLTRDVIEATLSHDGFEVRLFDAPGAWTEATGVNREAQRLATEWRKQADLVIELSPEGENARKGAHWSVRSRADKSESGISIHRPASLSQLKDDLVEHLLGDLRRLPDSSLVALDPELRSDILGIVEGANSADSVRDRWLG